MAGQSICVMCGARARRSSVLGLLLLSVEDAVGAGMEELAPAEAGSPSPCLSRTPVPNSHADGDACLCRIRVRRLSQARCRYQTCRRPHRNS